MAAHAEASIYIKKETREALKNYGRKNQTYDDILQELLKKANNDLNSKL